LEAAIAHPEDEARRVRLVAALAEAMQRDPAFARELRGHWQAASVELTADRGGVVNQFSGQADTVVQARDIHGDLSFEGVGSAGGRSRHGTQRAGCATALPQ
jgi:hypothetical protein